MNLSRTNTNSMLVQYYIVLVLAADDLLNVQIYREYFQLKA